MTSSTSFDILTFSIRVLNHTFFSRAMVKNSLSLPSYTPNRVCPATFELEVPVASASAAITTLLIPFAVEVPDAVPYSTRINDPDPEIVADPVAEATLEELALPATLSDSDPVAAATLLKLALPEPDAVDAPELLPVPDPVDSDPPTNESDSIPVADATPLPILAATTLLDSTPVADAMELSRLDPIIESDSEPVEDPVEAAVLALTTEDDSVPEALAILLSVDRPTNESVSVPVAVAGLAARDFPITESDSTPVVV